MLEHTITILFWAGFGKQAKRKENLLLIMQDLMETTGAKADITAKAAEKLSKVFGKVLQM